MEILFGEMLGIVVSVFLLVDSVTDTTVRIRTDNIPVLNMVRENKCPLERTDLTCLLRELSKFRIKNRIRLELSYIKSEDNVISDGLSRNRLDLISKWKKEGILTKEKSIVEIGYFWSKLNKFRKIFERSCDEHKR